MYIDENIHKEQWYGFDEAGNVVDTFYGSYGDAVDYFNSEGCSQRVSYFDRKNCIE